MKNRRKMLLAALVPVAFAVGWLCGAVVHRASLSGIDAKEEQTAEELRVANETITRQRMMLRDETLSSSRRSVEELFGLFPAKYPQGDWSPAETVFEDCWFQALDGIRLHGWYARHAHPQAVLLFLHGNAGNVADRAAVCAYMREDLSASVLLFDYRGYGRSEGQPTIEGMLNDARAARDYLAARERVEPRSVVLLGRSFGGALAVELAAEEGARGIVLESTFSSLRDVAGVHYPPYLVNLLVADRLKSSNRIRGYHGPLLQSHGDSDRVIPFASGQRLFDNANQPKTFVRVPGADHKDAQSPD